MTPIGITEGDIQDSLFFLLHIQIQRHEGSTILGKVFQYTDVSGRVEHHRTLTMKTIQFLIKWTVLHSMLFLLCQLFALSFLPFLLFPLMICFFQCVLSLGIFFWLIPFRLSIPD